MSVKFIGKASIDLKDGVWTVQGFSHRFLMNQRIIETRTDYKEYRKNYEKVVQRNTPPVRKIARRKEYVDARTKTKKDLEIFMVQVYQEILKDSHTYPVPLRLEQGYARLSDWRYCLYRANIYHFNRPGLSDNEMISQIDSLGGGQPAETHE